MALKKSIKQSNGLVTDYHRIFFIQSLINKHISIAVLSYVDAQSRESENDNGTPYTAEITYEKPYEENMTIESAYQYLKTLPAFEGAEDI